MSELEGHLVQQIKELRSDVHEVQMSMQRVITQLEHGSDRFDRICNQLEKSEDRIDVVERRIDMHDGELRMIKWIWSGLVGIGVIAAAFIMLFK